jgi:hypothetical protein
MNVDEHVDGRLNSCECVVGRLGLLTDFVVRHCLSSSFLQTQQVSYLIFNMSKKKKLF